MVELDSFPEVRRFCRQDMRGFIVKVAGCSSVYIGVYAGVYMAVCIRRCVHAGLGM